MHKINILDKELKKISYNDCRLALLVSRDGYCLSVKDVSQNRYMALKCQPVENNLTVDEVGKSVKDFIKDIWSEEKKIKCSHIVHSTPDSLLIPKAFSDYDNRKEILNFHYPDHVLNKREISEKFERENFILSGLVDKTLNDKLKKEFNPENVTLSASGLINSALSNTSEKVKTLVYVHVWKGYLDLVAVKNKELVLFNSYGFNTESDIVYFILNVYRQLVLDPKECKLLFTGWIDKKSSAVVQLNKFVKNIYFETLNSEHNYSYHFQDSLPHYFVNFLNIV